MAERIPPRDDRLVAAGLTKRYGDGPTAVTAVRDVSFAVAPGGIVLILGPSGSGKTTLLLMLGALLKPTAGTIALDGQVISALDEDQLPDIRLRRFGFIIQDFNLLPALTALDNGAFVAQLAGLKAAAARLKATSLLSDLGAGVAQPRQTGPVAHRCTGIWAHEEDAGDMLRHTPACSSARA